jgi:hypothetical protein
MVELMCLALWNSLIGWGRSPVSATRTVAADAATLKAVVSDPASQWRLVDGISPLLRPRAHVTPGHHPRFVHACVRSGRREVLWITWILTPGEGTTEVDLIAQLESRSVLARMAMVLGGRRWLRTRLTRTLGVLGTLAHRVAEDLDDVERHPTVTATASTIECGIVTVASTQGIRMTRPLQGP